jgi:hypothetical protein
MHDPSLIAFQFSVPFQASQLRRFALTHKKISFLLRRELCKNNCANVLMDPMC